MPRFTVDTHLFTELGELLVGRESTALIELVKNAYDADATEVVVYGEHLGDPKRGRIVISDNGVGMDPETFERGFLRIASRTRLTEDRKSVRWKRRYTGAKGVGRLAAHKLARRLDVISVPWQGEGRSGAPMPGMAGHIDWDEIEKVETLDEIPETAVSVVERPVKKPVGHGTVLTLSRLRQKWTKTQLSRFLTEVEGLRVPEILCQPIPRSVVPQGGLFDRPLVADAGVEDPGFGVRPEGDFLAGESYWPAVLETTSWLLEIDASPQEVRYRVAPTRRTLAELPQAEPVTLAAKHPSADQGPYFQARILIREGAPGSGGQKEFAARVAGVRVYMEGFRALPYGDPSDDWLFLTTDSSARSRKLRFLDDPGTFGYLDKVKNENLFLLPNKHYLGAVFLTSERAKTLKMLVNREGFLPDGSFQTLIELVRRGVDLSTRIRAAAKANATREPVDTDASSLKQRTEGLVERLQRHTNELRDLAHTAPPPLAMKITTLASKTTRTKELAEKLLPASSMVLVLASVGTQHAAFVHEINHLLSVASSVEGGAKDLLAEQLPPKLRARIAKVVGWIGDLRRAIERQAAYLVDIVTPDARRRRSRLRIGEVLAAAWLFLARVAEQRGVRFLNKVDPVHQSPPMFRAELMAVFSNLLTNAVKAAGSGGMVRVRSTQLQNGKLVVRIENTGTEIGLADAERWFQPFESTTLEADPVLGQGMGMGLTITRDLLAEIGATIEFVQPNQGFATAIKIVFPGVP
ncbi:MAG: hypothetical protein HC897_05135 [Thermoanaerobaculia bacterium]|nr:hypothetical protein [Thermoanaerobaculia bacterium]